jgi:hypothetical protein
MLEGVTRLSGYSEVFLYDPIYMPFHGDIPYVLKPNLLGARVGLVYINTDTLGLRSEVAGAAYGPKRDDEYRIAVIGDSYTFGIGVRNEDTFCRLLENNLIQRYNKLKVQVFNFGVPSYSVKEMVATLQLIVMNIKPDYIILAMIPGDLMLSRVASIDKYGYLCVSGYKDSYIKVVLRKMHLIYIIRELYYNYTKSLNKQFSLKYMDKIDIDKSFNYILKFKQIAIDNKLSYCVVILPSIIKGDVESEDTLKTMLQRHEVNFINLAALSQNFSINQFKASKFDTHPSAIVHKKIAEELSGRLALPSNN